MRFVVSADLLETFLSYFSFCFSLQKVGARETFVILAMIVAHLLLYSVQPKSWFWSGTEICIFQLQTTGFQEDFFYFFLLKFVLFLPKPWNLEKKDRLIKKNIYIYMIIVVHCTCKWISVKFECIPNWFMFIYGQHLFLFWFFVVGAGSGPPYCHEIHQTTPFATCSSHLSTWLILHSVSHTKPSHHL